MFCSVLFFSRPRSEVWPQHGRTFYIYLCPLSFSLTSTRSPVHVLMLSMQAMRGLPRLRAPGIVPCIVFLQATRFFPHDVTTYFLMMRP